MVKKVYLDANSTTGMLAEVKQEIESLLSAPYNPSSMHSAGRRAKSIIDNAREEILTSLGGKRGEYNLLFTSSATEANNLVIHNFADADIFISSIEHASILKPAKECVGTVVIKVDGDGRLDLNELEYKLAQSKSDRKLVSVIFANNETGVIQKISDIAKIAHRYNALVHTDAVQAYGKLCFTFDEIDVDMLTISSHKCGGPVGVGALIYRSDLALYPQILGGGQEKGLRSGTENVVLIAGMGRVATLLQPILHLYGSMRDLRAYLEQRLLEINPDIQIFSNAVLRIPNTSCFTMPGVSSDVQLIHFDLAGICVSAGAACSSGRIQTSSVLLNMGVEKNVADTAIRVSLTTETTKEDIDYFIEKWQEIYTRLINNEKEQDRLVRKAFDTVISSSDFIH